MKIICPNCLVSIEQPPAQATFQCPECGLTSDISKLDTAPGSAMAPLLRDLSGESLGGYKIGPLIGIGGMGVVYQGTHKKTETPVAIKLLHRMHGWNEEEFVGRFKREIEALSSLKHPNIVKILDSGKEGEIYYLVTEYIDGANLSSYLKSGRLDAKEIFQIMKQISSAISYAHKKGIVHRDIKPANIVLSDGRPKVLDFGLAQITTSNRNATTTLTRTDIAMGTFNYLSPEQRKGAKSVDARTDVFSLGVVFFEMLTGELPIGSFEPPSKTRADVGKYCDQVVLKSLSPNPEDRYQSVEEMLQAISKLDHPRPRIRQSVAITATLILLFAVLLFVIQMIPSSDDSTSKQVPNDKVEHAQALKPADEVVEQAQALKPVDDKIGQAQAPRSEVEDQTKQNVISAPVPDPQINTASNAIQKNGVTDKAATPRPGKSTKTKPNTKKAKKSRLEKSSGKKSAVQQTATTQEFQKLKYNSLGNKK